jgi:hypothetical protein
MGVEWESKSTFGLTTQGMGVHLADEGWRIAAPGICLRFFANLKGADFNGEQLKGCERVVPL